MRAEIALGSRVFFRVDVECVVRARLHARFAAYTESVVEVDDAVGPLEKCNSRTDFDAGSIVAVIASENTEVKAGVRERPLFDVLYPRTIHTDGNIVLFLAGHGAGMTADTARLIDEESVTHGPR